VRILLDENLPEGIEPLRGLGHVVDSVGSLGLKGLANGPLYREIAVDYDLFFTKDQRRKRVVVYVHGGKWIAGDKSEIENYPPLLDFFVSLCESNCFFTVTLDEVLILNS